MRAKATRAATTDQSDPAGRLSAEAAGRRLNTLFEEHGRMVYGVCRLLLRDPEDAEDASQQTFLLAHRSLLAGTEPSDPAAWLGTIARNECRLRLRSRMDAPLVLAHEPAGRLDVDQEADRRAEIESLCAALAELPHQQREALVLREFYGLSYGEVRAALGVTDSAVESLIFRARKRLQKELRPARIASGALVLPIALHDSLAHAVPGFVGVQRVGILAKLAGAPLAAKLAAATLTVAAAGVMGATAVERQLHRAPAVDPGVAAKKPSSPSRFLGDPHLVSIPGASDAPSTDPVASHGDGKDDGDSQGGPGARGNDPGDEDDAAGAQDADEDQSSDVVDDNDGSPADTTEDGGETNTGDTGADDSNGDGSPADRAAETDGNTGSSTTDGDG